MGCQSEVTIGDNLTFSITTHDPDTGVLTDADSAPSYRVYEDETGTAILTGSMAKLDDANTTGFYTEQLACTSGNGFEDGKSYTIYIEATVDSDQGGMSYGFKAVSQDATDNYSRLGAPAGASIAADLVTIDDFVDDLESRLTATRAGYLDNLNGHTAQTGDNYARLGAPAGASVSADIATVDGNVDSILADTNELQSDDVPGLIAGLNDVSAAEVNTQVDTAIEDYGLDHLVSASVAGIDVADNSIFAYLVSKEATADWDDFDNTTDSMQAVRDRGDSAWITATGFSTHDDPDPSGYLDAAISSRSSHDDPDPSGYLDAAISSRSDHAAADVWSVATRELTGGANLNDISAADVWAHTGMTAGGVADAATIMATCYASARGKIVKTDDSYAYYDDDGTTLLYTLTIATSERTTA